MPTPKTRPADGDLGAFYASTPHRPVSPLAALIRCVAIGSQATRKDALGCHQPWPSGKAFTTSRGASMLVSDNQCDCAGRPISGKDAFMQCSCCAAENDAGARLCASCGATLAAHCHNCGAELPGGARFCPGCGRALAPAAQIPVPGPVPQARTGGTTTLTERKQVTVLFADVFGYTALSERLDAEEVMDRMNALWARLDPIITRYGGTVNQHMGDGIMALFGAGPTRETEPRQAVRAALALQLGKPS